jgi:hypothetical protein
MLVEDSPVVFNAALGIAIIAMRKSGWLLFIGAVGRLVDTDQSLDECLIVSRSTLALSLLRLGQADDDYLRHQNECDKPSHRPLHAKDGYGKWFTSPTVL